MQNPLNPSNNQISPDDYMLDTLERSIEKTIGPPDPLMARQNSLVDDIARQLNRVEASIENMPPLWPKFLIDNDRILPDVQNSKIGTPETTLPIGDFGASANLNGIEQATQNVPKQGVSQNPSTMPIRQNGDGIRKHGHSAKNYKPLFGGRTNAQSNVGLRHCPQSHELIDMETCESCEKYRHWPDGTNEEPRECWHDWQLTRFCNKDETEDGDE
jgi:hypothetical protein